MRGNDEFWGGLVCVGVPLGVIALAILLSWLQPKRRPMLLGTPLREFPNGLQPEKFYDVTIGTGGRFDRISALSVIHRVKVLGATETAKKGWFDDWVVLEHADGRKAYVPRNQICLIEESVANDASRPEV